VRGIRRHAYYLFVPYNLASGYLTIILAHLPRGVTRATGRSALRAGN
jgi:hypothetical protein